MLTIVLVLFAVVLSSSSHRLHYTNDHLDCLKLYSTDRNKEISSLVSYCLGSREIPTITHCYGKKLTFDELKTINVTVSNLYVWNAPVDTMNDYQMFLIDVLIARNRIYCNCTDLNWFGLNCEYTFIVGKTPNRFVDILNSRLLSIKSSSARIPFVPSNTTCYEGLVCNSFICLDWRDICNGIWECADGEDEANCTEIDIWKCGHEQFRCRNGMCIDRNFLFDAFNDCADRSDEQKKKPVSLRSGLSSQSFFGENDEFSCPWKMFSCEDGTCENSLLSCKSSRQAVYLALLFANPHENDSNDTLCWETMICSMVAIFGQFFHSSSLNCQNRCHNYDSDCFKLRLSMCPKYYFFPSKSLTSYSSVYFMYDITLKNVQLNDMMLSTFICFDKDACPLINCKDLPIINNLKCDHYTNQWKSTDLSNWNVSTVASKKNNYIHFITRFYQYYKTFHSSKCSEKFYNCRWTNTCISNFWLDDGEEDCKHGDDENSEEMCKLNTPDYFRCKTFASRTICIHRKYLMDSKSDCTGSGSDEIYPLTCNIGNSLGCRYLRNDISHLHNGYFVFQELCNGIRTFVDYTNNNETDENDCDEWQNSCNNRAEPCFKKEGWESCISKVWKCEMTIHLKYKQFTFEGFNQHPSISTTDQDSLTTSTSVSKTTKRSSSSYTGRPGALDALLFPSRPARLTTKFAQSILYRDVRPTPKIPTRPSRAPKATTGKHFQSETDNSLSDYILYYCNRGVLLTTRDGKDRCLCPPSYYGHSCQYQSRRVLMIISIDATELYQSSSSLLRLVVSLVSDDDDQAFDVEEIVHILALHSSTWRHLVYLRYPHINKFRLYYVRVDVFLVTSKSVSLQSSWRYEIVFQHILPVNRIRVNLQTSQVQNNNTCSLCSNGKCIVYANVIEKSYCLCNVGWYGRNCQLKSSEPITSCDLGAQILFKNICVCLLFTFGDKCYIQLDFHHTECANGGRLLSESSPSLCLCPAGFHGSVCQFKDANVILKFSEGEHVKTIIPIVAIHLLDLDSDVSITRVKARLIYTNVQPSSTVPIIIFHGKTYLPSFIFVQLYFDRSNADGEFFLMALLKEPINSLHIDMHNVFRCPNVNTLLNSTIINQYSLLKRYKFYFKICLIQSRKCFLDENYLCLCDNFARFECLWFDHQASNCNEKRYCQNEAHCVEATVKTGSIKFACLCAACTFGDLCQFTTAHYHISLDALVGMSGAIERFTVSYIIFGIVLLFFIIGLVCNLFSFIILCHSPCQTTGCGFYILCLSLVGQIGLIAFVLKFVFLLIPSANYNHNLWSCRILESTISFISPIYDWLTACIAIERTLITMQGLHFNKVRSKQIARYIAFPAVILLTLGSTFHKALYRQMITDFRTNKPTWWCVMEISQSSVKVYDIVINIIHLVVPLSINILTTLYFLLATTRRKKNLLNRRANINISYCNIFREQLSTHIAFIISPAILGLLQTPRLILSFAFVCIQAPWQVHFYIISYLISCLPLMAGTLLLFIIPSPIYRENIKTIFDRIRCTCKRNRSEKS